VDVGDCETLVTGGRRRVEADDAGLPSGTRIGRYVILRPLGAGAAGVVYAARDPELGRDVALKVLRGRLGRCNAAVAARLLREARAMGRCSHPNVIAVHDFGIADGLAFIAMELVQGRTLSAWLAERKRTKAEIVSAFVQAGRGLAAAHQQGLVHRDFKPHNVLVGFDGRVVVADFGLAQPRTTSGARFPALRDPWLAPSPGEPLGTPAYMAPEQWGRHRVGARTDVWSFCVALHEALFGERPHLGRSPIASSPGRMPTGRSVPRRIRRALARGLTLDPLGRCASMDPLLRELTLAIHPRRWWIALAAPVLLFATAILLGAASEHVPSPAALADAMGLHLAGERRIDPTASSTHSNPSRRGTAPDWQPQPSSAPSLSPVPTAAVPSSSLSAVVAPSVADASAVVSSPVPSQSTALVGGALQSPGTPTPQLSIVGK
jgi:serine/threonine protein kinase